MEIAELIKDIALGVGSFLGGAAAVYFQHRSARAEIKDKERQFAESLDKAEEKHRMESAKCGTLAVAVGKLLDDPESDEALRTARDAFCSQLNHGVIPAFISLFRLKCINHSRKWNALERDLEGAAKAIRLWNEQWVTTINHPKLLARTGMTPIKISRYTLQEFREAIEDAPGRSKAKHLLLDEINRLIATCEQIPELNSTK